MKSLNAYSAIPISTGTHTGTEAGTNYLNNRYQDPQTGVFEAPRDR